MERLQAGAWWKFDRYEIHEGYIRPAPGAQLVKYDPWDMYQQAASQKAGVIPPHTELFRLITSIRFERTGGEYPTLTKESADHLVQWCGTYGLLGVLLQRTQMVTFPHRWGPAGVPAGYLMPTYRRFSRTNWGWTSRSEQTMYSDTPLIQDMSRLNELVPDGQLPSKAPRPSVLFQDLRSGDCELADLDKSWAVYFPTIPEPDRPLTRYPVPLTPEFWHLYSEPVAVFIDAAATLVDAVTEIDKLKNPEQAADTDTVRRRMEPLHILLGPVSPVIQLTDKGFREKWISPSLLSALSMMVFQDLTGGRRVLKCGACGSYFFSSAYQAHFCSERCRQTGQKRQWRRSRAAKPTHQE